MAVFEFEIQKCIKIQIIADDEIEARMILIDNPSLFQEKMIEDCYISDGKVILEKCGVINVNNFNVERRI